MYLLSILSALLLCGTHVLSAPSPQLSKRYNATNATNATNTTQYSLQIQKIINRAKSDGIDLLALPFAAAAFAGIEEVVKPIKINQTAKSERIDVHGACTENPPKL